MLAFGFPIFDDLIFCQLQGARNTLANEDYINDTVWTYWLYIDITHNSRQLLPTLYNIGVLTLDYILYKHQRRCVPKPNRAIFFRKCDTRWWCLTDHKDHYAACMYKMWLAIKPVEVLVDSPNLRAKSKNMRVRSRVGDTSGILRHSLATQHDATGETGTRLLLGELPSWHRMQTSSSQAATWDNWKSKTCKQITESIVETNLHCCILYIYIIVYVYYNILYIWYVIWYESYNMSYDVLRSNRSCLQLQLQRR